MKKIIMLALIFLISGCSCKYELSIQGNKIEESLYINGINMEIPEQADLANYSTHNYSKNIDGDMLNYSTSYNLSSFKNSDFLTCFDTYNFVNENEYYIIRTGKKFKCLPYQYNDFDMLDYDELEIQITTNHKVLEHNAVKVDDNTYSWYITKENIDNAEIYMKFSEEVNSPLTIPIIAGIFTVVLILGFIIYNVASSKGKKNNKI